MGDEFEHESFQPYVSADHRRVIDVRMREIEELSSRLEGLLRAGDAANAYGLNLDPSAKGRVEVLLLDLRKVVAKVNDDLGIEVRRREAAREARAVLAALAVSIEEVHPDNIQGYGKVREPLARYLERCASELSGIAERIGKETGLGPSIVELKD